MGRQRSFIGGNVQVESEIPAAIFALTLATIVFIAKLGRSKSTPMDGAGWNGQQESIRYKNYFSFDLLPFLSSDVHFQNFNEATISFLHINNQRSRFNRDYPRVRWRRRRNNNDGIYDFQWLDDLWKHNYFHDFHFYHRAIYNRKEYSSDDEIDGENNRATNNDDVIDANNNDSNANDNRTDDNSDFRSFHNENNRFRS